MTNIVFYEKIMYNFCNVNFKGRSMFNYLSNVENTFFSLWNNAHSFDLEKIEDRNWPNDIKNYAQYLATPFSSDTLNQAHFKVFFNNFLSDILFILTPITGFNEALTSSNSIISGLFWGILYQIPCAIMAATGIIDILLLATTLSLGLATRSLATLGYMLNYAINGAEPEGTRAKLQYSDILGGPDGDDSDNSNPNKMNID